MALSTFEAAAAKVNESLKMVGELTDLASLFNVGLFDVATLTRVKTLQPRCGFHRCWNMILHVFCLGSPGVMILWNIMRDYLAVVGSWISTRVVAWLVDDSNPRGQQVRDMNSTAMKAINDLDDKAMVAVISWASQWSPEKCTINIHSDIVRYLGICMCAVKIHIMHIGGIMKPLTFDSFAKLSRQLCSLHVSLQQLQM